MSALEIEISFLLFAVLQSMFIVGVKSTFEPGMIFGGLRKIVDNNLNEFWRKPIYSCVKCMSGLYGALTYFPTVIFVFGWSWILVPAFFFDVGVLIFLNYVFYKRQ